MGIHCRPESTASASISPPSMSDLCLKESNRLAWTIRMLYILMVRCEALHEREDGPGLRITPPRLSHYGGFDVVGVFVARDILFRDRGCTEFRLFGSLYGRKKLSVIVQLIHDRLDVIPSTVIAAHFALRFGSVFVPTKTLTTHLFPKPLDDGLAAASKEIERSIF